MGSLRLPTDAARRLRASAKRSGATFADLLRRALQEALKDTSRLAVTASRPSGSTVRLGALPMPAELAQALNVAAQELGVSVAEVVRRALESSASRRA